MLIIHPCHALCIAIAAYPHRDQSIPRRYEVAVGQPVRLLNGVGEGALVGHYHVRWDKGFNRVTETEGVSYERGDDLSLLFASVKMSDSGTYRPTVTVSDEHYVEPEIHIELVVYSKSHVLA